MKNENDPIAYALIQVINKDNGERMFPTAMVFDLKDSHNMPYSSGNCIDRNAENIFFAKIKKQTFLDDLSVRREKGVRLDFHGINLSHADLSDTDLNDVDLTGADLSYVNLSGATLHGANLTGAILLNAIVQRADLTDSVIVDIVVDRTTQLALQQALSQIWYQKAKRKIDQFDAKWSELNSLEGFVSFENFLKRIHAWELREYISAEKIVDLIEHMLKNKAIARTVIQFVIKRDVRCHSHLLIVMNTIQNMAACMAQAISLREEEIHDLAKALLKQELLEEVTLPVMRKQWREGRRLSNKMATGPDIQDVFDVQCILQHQLAHFFALPISLDLPSKIMEKTSVDNTDVMFAKECIEHILNDSDQFTQLLEAVMTRTFMVVPILNYSALS